MKIPIENKGKSPIYVGGVMIPDGETRHIDAELLPPEYRQEQTVVAEQGTEPANPLAEILKAPVKNILAGVATLSVEDLQALVTLEQGAEKPRSTLINALSAEVLERLGKQEQGEQGGQGEEGAAKGGEGAGEGRGDKPGEGGA